jgi:hypothetical protein
LEGIQGAEQKVNVAIEAASAGAVAASVKFPYLPFVSADSVRKRLFSGWAYLMTGNSNNLANFAVAIGGIGGVRTYVSLGLEKSNSTQLFRFTAAATDNESINFTKTTSLSYATWYHVAAYYDRDTPTLARLYLNGVLELSGTDTVTAALLPESGIQFDIVNNYSQSKDVRVYNMDTSSISPDALARELYLNGVYGTAYQEGLAFQFGEMPISEYTSRLNTELDANVKIYDKISGAEGTPAVNTGSDFVTLKAP